MVVHGLHEVFDDSFRFSNSRVLLPLPGRFSILSCLQKAIEARRAVVFSEDTFQLEAPMLGVESLPPFRHVSFVIL